MVNSKMIIVKSRGYVNTSRGRVFAPISRPYRESPSTILRMITQDHADVYEVIQGLGEVKLTTTNFDRDNSVKIDKVAPSIPNISPVKTIVSSTPVSEHESSDAIASVKTTGLLSNTPTTNPIDMGNPPDPGVAPKPGAFSKTNTSVLMDHPEEDTPEDDDTEEDSSDDVEEESAETNESVRYPDGQQYRSGRRNKKRRNKGNRPQQDQTTPREMQ